MAEKILGTNLAGPIVPFTTDDKYPTHYAQYGKGGFRCVETESDLESIPVMRREVGMLVYVISSKYAYQWNGNKYSDWRKNWDKSKIGGGVEKIEGFIDDLTKEDNPDLFEDGTIVYSESSQEYYYYLIDNDPEEGDGHWYRWGQLIHVGGTPPVSKNSLWIDTREHYFSGDDEELNSIWTAIQILQEKLGLLMNIRTSGVISGDISEGTRTSLINSATPEKPRAVIENEADSFDIENLDYFREDLENLTTASEIEEVFTPVQSYLLILKENEGADSSEAALNTIKVVVGNYSSRLNEIVPEFFSVLSACSAYTDEIIQPAIDLAIQYQNPSWDPSTTEIEPEKDIEPTVSHISIKMGTKQQLLDNILNFVPGELMWCTDESNLYIYVNGKLKAISGSSDGGGGNNSGNMNDSDKLIVRQIIGEELNNIDSLGFIPINSTSTDDKYTAKVNEEGKLIVYRSDLDKENPEHGTNLYFGNKEVYPSSVGLLINSFYLGGTDNDEHSYQPCSHNFIEISNVYVDPETGKPVDINLNGFYLHYKGLTDDTTRHLKLWGVVPGGGTFLIRGAQCSVMDVNTTKIKVKTYDMEWFEKEEVVTEEGKKTVKHLIKFDQTGATFYLSWYPNNTEGAEKAYKFYTQKTSSSEDTPSATEITNSSQLVTIDKDNGVYSCAKGFIDLIGVCDPSYATEGEQELAYANKVYIPNTTPLKDVIIRRWYQLDPVSQSNPKDGVENLNNAKYTTSLYLMGGNIDDQVDITEYTPKASWEGKNIATARTLFSEKYPSTLTCTFGCQATDNTVTKFVEETDILGNVTDTLSSLPDNLNDYEIGDTLKVGNESDGFIYYVVTSRTPQGIGATRCFCWNSVGYYDEGIKLRKKTSQPGEESIFTDWISIESIKIGTSYSVPTAPFITEETLSENGRYDDINGKTIQEVFIEGYKDKYYSRVRWESAYGQPMTTHRVIIRGLTAGDYEYQVYRVGDESYTNKDNRNRKFSIRTDKDVVKNGFNFVQTTDQQGANWEEYEVWNLSAKVIKRENNRWLNGYWLNRAGQEPTWIEPRTEGIPEYDFTINTGDICYNGSRSNEWIDYFIGYEPLDDKVEMLTIGNNDLSPITMRDIGDGSESPWKLGTNVIDYFYTYEIDRDNPQLFIGRSKDDVKKASNEYKMPSLYSFNYGEYHFISLLSETRTISHKVKVTENPDDTVTVGKQSSLDESTVNAIYGVYDETREVYDKDGNLVMHTVDGNSVPVRVPNASRSFDTEEEWLIKDLIKWRSSMEFEPVDVTTGSWVEKYNTTIGTGYDPGWKYRDRERYNSYIVGKCQKCIIFTHEMPFNIISPSSYKIYNQGSKAPREVAKAYLNRFHNFEFQRLFKLWGIPMVMGGHKHTCAITHPVYDAPLNYNPITKRWTEGQSNEYGYSDEILFDKKLVNAETQEYTYSFDNSASFAPIMQITPLDFESHYSSLKSVCKQVYFNVAEETSVTVEGHTYSAGDIITNEDISNPKIRLEVVDEITAPSYIMCQATGFKNKSNSELAAPGIPWERFYVANNELKKQCKPFFTSYEINSEQIVVNMYSIDNMYESGKETSGSSAGYWDLVKIYSPGYTLQENREMLLSKCTIQQFNSNGTVIKVRNNN